MSLSLIQSYSSAEEEADEQVQFQNSSDEDEIDEDEAPSALKNNYNTSKSAFDFPQQQQQSGGSALPSAFDAFSEITGPPRFLNNSAVEEEHVPPENFDRRGRNRKEKKKKNLPAGVVVEANAQLVGMHERVRSDVEGTVAAKSSAATISIAQSQMNKGEKNKGSTVKDKEKSKRMRGQSSHATWKSETEMQLRQHFD